MFKKATLDQIKIRLAISGASGSGKTYSALAIASHLGKSIAVIDSEHGSASRYANIFNFDACELRDFHPAKYIEAIGAAETAGYEVIIIDSLSHAWYAELELVERKSNSFAGWKDVRPLERKLIDTMLSSRCHIIATMRSKTEWVIETDARGKSVPRKVGTTPIQTSGIEFEFDIAGEMDQQHILTISKSRCPELSDRSFLNPGKEVVDILKSWINSSKTIKPEPEPWKHWKSEEDAIAWAEKQLPGVSREKITAEFTKLQPTNGKKAPAWVNHVYQMTKF